MSKQFLEDKSGGETAIYCKRALPNELNVKGNHVPITVEQTNQ